MASISKRSRSVYYTAAQVAVYLNGYLIDDACSIAYDVVDSWQPLFGHSDRHFRTLTEGQTIVTGELSVIFRYHGYLKRVISAIQDAGASMAGTAEQIVALRRGQTAQPLSDAALQHDAAAVLNYLDASAESSKEVFDKAADFLKARFWGDAGPARSRDISSAEIQGNAGHESQENRDDRRKYQDYMRPSMAREKGLRLRIVHGSDENIGKRAFAESIEQIQFRGKSYRANIVVPQGETICTEVYPFIARDVKPI